MIKLGIERLDEYDSIFKGKRVGLITNPSGYSTNLRKQAIDIVKEKCNLVCLFSPEHGVRGNIQAGAKLETYFDEKTGCKVYSLYGTTKRPTEEMLQDIDVLCMDIQDVGSRFYTYIYTMAYAMEACKEYGKKFVIFDRPNPIASKFEGNILDITYRSFIGYYPIVQRHGMTIAELAIMYNKEFQINCDLSVVPMEGWERNSYFDSTDLFWITPSPNIPTINSAIAYNATCIFEGTNVSEGRGTTIPFEYVGAPWIDGWILADKLNNMGLPGVYFRQQYITPTFSKHKEIMCDGVVLHVLDREKFAAVKTGWTMLHVIRELYPNDFIVTVPKDERFKYMLDLNTGCNYIRENKYTLEEQYGIIERDTEIFASIRKKYLIY